LMAITFIIPFFSPCHRGGKVVVGYVKVTLITLHLPLLVSSIGK